MFWAIILLPISAIFLLLNNFLRKNKKFLPPGPHGYPIIGHLHLLGKNPHRDLHNLSKKYGPIMHLQLGFVTNVIVSSPNGAEQFLKTHDLVFATRPPHQAAKYISYDQRNLTFSKYGSYWRNMRKLCTLHLLSNLKIHSFQSMRKREIDMFVKSLKKTHKEEAVDVAVDLSSEISTLSTNMTCLMVFGKKYLDGEFHDRGFKDVMQESMHLSAKPNLGDYFPFIGVLDPQGLNRRMKKISKIYDQFLEKIIDEHEKLDEGKDQSHDFVSTMLALLKSGEVDFDFDRRHIKAVMLVRQYYSLLFFCSHKIQKLICFYLKRLKYSLILLSEIRIINKYELYKLR